MEERDACCPTDNKPKKGWRSGLFFGLIPHSLCIAFVIFSIIGATGATALTKQFLLIPNVFSWLVVISVLFAVVSAGIYLKRTNNLSLAGIKAKKRYLATLMGATIASNLIVLYVLFPAASSFHTREAAAQEPGREFISLEVEIPCSGHAPLIMDEIKKDPGVQSVMFNAPSNFTVGYNPIETTPDRIRSLEIFNTFKLAN